MVAGFKRKKIRHENTIGEILKNRRRRKGFSLQEVEDQTHIRIRFLQAIESDCWEKMPSEAYARGYVECYAQFLGLDKAALIDKFDREKHLYRRSNDDLSIKPTQRPLTTMWLITPRTLAVLVSVVVVVFLTSYIGFQVRSFAAAPDLVITNPANRYNNIVRSDKYVLAGRTSQDARVEINGKAVNVKSDGSFAQEVGLSRGENTFIISAIGRNMKSTAELVTIKALY